MGSYPTGGSKISSDVSTGHELRTLTGHNNRVTGVAMSADGRLAISAPNDKILKV